MSLTVLSVAFPMAPVGPDAVGGAEQVLTHLDTALQVAGHQSIVIAAKGSQTAGKLIDTPCWGGIFDDQTTARAAVCHQAAIAHALDTHQVDLIHLHGVDFLNYLPPPGPPVLVTLHLPLNWYSPEVFHLDRPETYLNCVSETQRGARANSSHLPVIPNGVPENLFNSRHAKRSFVMSLGRICPEKGFHLALDAARQANSSMLLAGEIFPFEAHQDYFQKEIMSRLDYRRRFIGPLGFGRKRRMLTAADCLLVPSLVPETSSLVAMEAMACGTPVIAFRSGALTEVVHHGLTGFLVNTVKEMSEAIGHASAIHPDICRESARARFSLEKTVERYFALYAEVLRRARPDVSYESRQVTRYYQLTSR